MAAVQSIPDGMCDIWMS